jgi:hypothetical protein
MADARKFLFHQQATIALMIEDVVRQFNPYPYLHNSQPMQRIYSKFEVFLGQAVIKRNFRSLSLMI